MASLRTTASAARLLRSASHARTAVLPATRRYESSTSVPAKTEQQKKETSPMATLPRNAPDYSVPIDMATSYEAPRQHPQPPSSLATTNIPFMISDFCSLMQHLHPRP